MKNISILLIALFSLNSFSQVGIGTKHPQGKLHVDGQQDNPTSTQPNLEQQKNDVIITEDGKVGIGTTNPSAQLEVKGYIKVGTQEDEVATIPSVGMIRFNTTTSTFEGYVADAGSGSPGWVALH
jgi:hypothetical protein